MTRSSRTQRTGQGVTACGMQELFDSPESLKKKVKQLGDILRASKYSVVYTGAGISTSAGIPDYRGPSGVWTLKARGKEVAEPDFGQLEPTSSHYAIRTLLAKKLVRHVVSQNIDGLHRRSGIPPHQISELHGNYCLETCSSCGVEYFRPFAVWGGLTSAPGSTALSAARASLSARKISRENTETESNAASDGSGSVVRKGEGRTQRRSKIKPSKSFESCPVSTEPEKFIKVDSGDCKQSNCGQLGGDKSPTKLLTDSLGSCKTDVNFEHQVGTPEAKDEIGDNKRKRRREIARVQEGKDGTNKVVASADTGAGVKGLGNGTDLGDGVKAMESGQVLKCFTRRCRQKSLVKESVDGRSWRGKTRSSPISSSKKHTQDDDRILETAVGLVQLGETLNGLKEMNEASVQEVNDKRSAEAEPEIVEKKSVNLNAHHSKVSEQGESGQLFQRKRNRNLRVPADQIVCKVESQEDVDLSKLETQDQCEKKLNSTVKRGRRQKKVKLESLSDGYVNEGSRKGENDATQGCEETCHDQKMEEEENQRGSKYVQSGNLGEETPRVGTRRSVNKQKEVADSGEHKSDLPPASFPEEQNSVALGRARRIRAKSQKGTETPSKMDEEALEILKSRAGSGASKESSHCKKEVQNGDQGSLDDHDHRTGRKCERKGCGGDLVDSVVLFGESMPFKAFQGAEDQSAKAEVALVLGSSLRVGPACDFPGSVADRGGKLVIVNLQRTPMDKKAALVIRGRCDQVMELLLAELDLLPKRSSAFSLLDACMNFASFPVASFPRKPFFQQSDVISSIKENVETGNKLDDRLESSKESEAKLLEGQAVVISNPLLEKPISVKEGRCEKNGNSLMGKRGMTLTEAVACLEGSQKDGFSLSQEILNDKRDVSSEIMEEGKRISSHGTESCENGGNCIVELGGTSETVVMSSRRLEDCVSDEEKEDSPLASGEMRSSELLGPVEVSGEGSGKEASSQILTNFMSYKRRRHSMGSQTQVNITPNVVFGKENWIETGDVVDHGGKTDTGIRDLKSFDVVSVPL